MNNKPIEANFHHIRFTPENIEKGTRWFMAGGDREPTNDSIITIEWESPEGPEKDKVPVRFIDSMIKKGMIVLGENIRNYKDFKVSIGIGKPVSPPRQKAPEPEAPAIKDAQTKHPVKILDGIKIARAILEEEEKSSRIGTVFRFEEKFGGYTVGEIRQAFQSSSAVELSHLDYCVDEPDEVFQSFSDLYQAVVQHGPPVKPKPSGKTPEILSFAHDLTPGK